MESCHMHAIHAFTYLLKISKVGWQIPKESHKHRGNGCDFLSNYKFPLRLLVSGETHVALSSNQRCSSTGRNDLALAPAAGVHEQLWDT